VLAERLDDPVFLLRRGRRAALPRHRTLGAMLDWSHQLLTDPERAILRRLAVFRGDFTLESAAAIAADDEISAADVVDGVINLGARSLVTSDVGGRTACHRLLHVIRAYAFAKLVESDERRLVLRRHAEHCCVLLTGAEEALAAMTLAEWLSTYGSLIDDVRAALDWAFSAEGDAAIGVALTAAALPLGFQLSLIDEFQRRVEHALERNAALSQPQPFAEMRLNAALGVLSQNTTGPMPGGIATLRASAKAG
jgi:predicted ATPase